jgi:hypothetical protein
MGGPAPDRSTDYRRYLRLPLIRRGRRSIPPIAAPTLLLFLGHRAQGRWTAESFANKPANQIFDLAA